MTAPQGPTSLTLSAITDGLTIDASDVTTPLHEAEDAIDEARETVAISSADTTVKYLEDAISAGSGITVTKQNTGANENLQIAATGQTFAALSDTPSSYADAAGDVPMVNSGETALEFMPAVPPATPLPSFMGVAPAGWLLANGQTVSMTIYKRLLDALITGANMLTVYGLSGGITVTADAATDKLLATAHGRSNGTVVMFGTSGTLPGGISANTPYYIVNTATNDFQISLTEGGAAVDITSAGTGTLTRYIYFKTPDMRGRTFVGLDNMGGTSLNVITDAGADSMGGKMGAETHTLTTAQIPAHKHAIRDSSDRAMYLAGTADSYAISSGYTGRISQGRQYTDTDGGSGGSHNNVQPSIFGNWIIKT